MAFSGFGRIINNLMNNVNTQISRTDCRVATLEATSLHSKQPIADYSVELLNHPLSLRTDEAKVTLGVSPNTTSYDLVLPQQQPSRDDVLYCSGQRLEWRRVSDQSLFVRDDVSFHSIRTNALHGNVYGNLIGNVSGQLEGLVMTEHQPNITSVGVLRELEVMGNAACRSIALHGGLHTATLRAPSLSAPYHLTLPDAPPAAASYLTCDTNNKLDWSPLNVLRCGDTALPLPQTPPQHRQIMVHEDGALRWCDLNQSFDQTLNSFDKVTFASVRAEVVGNVVGNLFGNVMTPHQPLITQVGVLEKLETNGVRCANQSKVQLCENGMYGGEKYVALQAPAQVAHSYSIQLPPVAPKSGEAMVVVEGKGEWKKVQEASEVLSQVARLDAVKRDGLMVRRGDVGVVEVKSDTVGVEWRDHELRLELPQPLHPRAAVTFDTLNAQKLFVSGENSVVDRNLFVNGAMQCNKLVASRVVRKMKRVVLQEAGDLTMHHSLVDGVVVIDFGVVRDEKYELRLVDSAKFVQLLELVDGDAFEVSIYNSSDIAGVLSCDDSYVATPRPLPPRTLTRVTLMKEQTKLIAM